MSRKNKKAPAAAATTAVVPTLSPTPSEVTSSAPATTVPSDDAAAQVAEIEEHMEVAQMAEVGPFEDEVLEDLVDDDETVPAAPTAGIDVATQDDFPAELGTVVASANYPDGARVVVTAEGKKFRRAAAGAPYLDTILLSA